MNTTTTTRTLPGATIHQLRARGRELGLANVMTLTKEALYAEIVKREPVVPADSTDFGDLPPPAPAPENEQALEPLGAPLEVEPEPQPPEPPPPPPPRIVLTPEQMLLAIANGQASGVPGDGKAKPTAALGGAIVVDSKTSEVTMAVGGHSVRATVVVETRLASWVVEGSADDLSGKFRLMNDVRYMSDTGLVLMKAGKEFYAHQVPIDRVKAAGGVVLPIGTTR